MLSVNYIICTCVPLRTESKSVKDKQANKQAEAMGSSLSDVTLSQLPGIGHVVAITRISRP